MTTDTRRRVKLYALNAERQWDDRGTGHVSSNYVDRLKGISLLVRAEADGSLLLESKIQPDTAYQKQQDTLIVWSEGDNFDLALSFQEKAGCDEIWEKICQVQGKDPSVEITQDIVEESEDERFEEISDPQPPIELPPCELSRLEDISETIANGLATPLRKEKLAVALESESYIKKLLNLFHVCEDLDNVEGLHHLFEIFKNIFLLNKNALFEIMFAEDTIFDVVGCLEYDPYLPQPKKHRQYLKQLAKFREAIPIKNADLLAKIHQTYRVQYIQDIILPTPSVFVEDNMLNTLSSFIFFNKVEIVTLIQEDEKFLIDLFALLIDTNTSDSKRRDLVLFLKEFCNFAQNLQPQGKDTFYKTLTCLGILQALEITLVMSDQKTKSASIDILTAIVEYSPSIVRNYTLQQVSKTDGERILINIAIEQMLSDSEPELGGAVQLMGVIRILLDPENMLTEKSEFLNLFYKHSIQTLIAPLILNTLGDKPQNEDYQTVQLLGLVLEILSFCVEHHTHHIKNFIIQKDLLKKILVLMKSTHTFLVLGALRLLRKIIALKDEFYNRHIVRCNLFAPVVDAFIRNNGRYNLLESAILELFEFIKLEDIRTLCVYFVENFSKIFDEIEYVQTFKYLKTRYDQYQERIKDRDKISSIDTLPMIRNNSRFRRDQRQMEEDEEIWFEDEEDFTGDLDSYSVMKNNKINDKNGPAAKQQNNSPTQSAISNNSNMSLNKNVPPASTQTSSGSSSPPSRHCQTSSPTTSLPAQHPLEHHLLQQQQQQAQSSPPQQQPQEAISTSLPSLSPTTNTESTAVEETSLTPTSLDSTSNPPAIRSIANCSTTEDVAEPASSAIETAAVSTVTTVTNVTDSVANNNGSNAASDGNDNNLLDEENSKQLVNVSEEAASSSSVVNCSDIESSESSNSSSNSNGSSTTDSMLTNAIVKDPTDSIQSTTGNTNTVKKGLVDYEGDSDEEDDEDPATNSPLLKKARLA